MEAWPVNRMLGAMALLLSQNGVCGATELLSSQEATGIGLDLAQPSLLAGKGAALAGSWHCLVLGTEGEEREDGSLETGGGRERGASFGGVWPIDANSVEVRLAEFGRAVPAARKLRSMVYGHRALCSPSEGGGVGSRRLQASLPFPCPADGAQPSPRLGWWGIDLPGGVTVPGLSPVFAPGE